jgi:hypothetical protein
MFVGNIAIHILDYVLSQRRRRQSEQAPRKPENSCPKYYEEFYIVSHIRVANPLDDTGEIPNISESCQFKCESHCSNIVARN